MSIEFIKADANDLYNNMLTILESNVNEELYPGDERRIFGEAMVALLLAQVSTLNQKAKQRFLKYAEGELLDAYGERLDEKRLEPDAAKTILRFGIQSPLPSNLIIPKGVRATPNSEVYFKTKNESIIPAGSLYIDVEAEASIKGSKYNGFELGSIKTIVDLIPYLASVTNITVSEGGNDGEPYTPTGDDSFRERLRLSSSSFSTAGPAAAYEYFALRADSTIGDVKAYSPSEGIVNIIVLMKDGTLPSEVVLNKVDAIVNDPKIRPLTDQVLVEAPNEITYDIEFHYYVNADTEGEVIQNIEGTDGAIERYIKWQSSKLKRNVNPDELRKMILVPSWADGLNGAIRVDLVSPSYQIISENQVARFSGIINVSHEVE